MIFVIGINMKLRNKLIRMHACQESIDWVAGRSLRDAWETCHRGDWMMWGLGYMAGLSGWPTRYNVTLLAVWCSMQGMLSADLSVKRRCCELNILHEIELCSRDSKPYEGKNKLMLYRSNPKNCSYSQRTRYAIKSARHTTQASMMSNLPASTECSKRFFARTVCGAANFAALTRDCRYRESLRHADYIRSVVHDFYMLGDSC